MVGGLRATAIGLVMCLLVPLAIAGDVLTRDTLRLPDGATLRGDPTAILAEGPAAARLLEIAPHGEIRVLLYEIRETELSLTVLRSEPKLIESRAFDGVLVRLDRPSEGNDTDGAFVGMHFEAGSRMEQVAVGTALVRALPHGNLSTREPVTTSARDRADQEDFWSRAAGPHLLAEAAGAISVEGAGRAKVFGYRVVVGDGPEGRAYDTGTWWENVNDARAFTRVSRFLTIEFAEGSVTFDADGARTLARGPLDAEWEGALAARAIDGGGTLAGFEEDGPHAARLVPRLAAGAPAVAIAATEPTSVASTPAAKPFASWTGGAGFWILLVAVGAGAPAAFALARRPRPAAPTETVEECIEHVERLLADKRPGEALHWIRRARAIAPSSSRLAIEEALALSAIGRNDEALEVLDGVAATTDDGEADFHATRILLKTCSDARAVEPRLARCLERTPAYALEFLSFQDESYRLAGDGLFERHLTAALARLRE